MINFSTDIGTDISISNKNIINFSSGIGIRIGIGTGTSE